MKRLIFILSLFINVSLHAYTDVFSDIGYTNVKTPFDDKVDILHFGLGSTLALGNVFFIGLQTEYKALTRLIKTNDQLRVYKNQKSLYVLPTIGFKIETYVFKFSYSGVGYYLLKQEKDKLISTSKDSTGIMLALLKLINKSWFLGSSYSTTFFKKVKYTGETAGQNSLNQTSRMITASIIVGINF